MDLSKVTIIIPSYKRQEYAINALKYWSKYDVNLHLLDGSDDPILNIDKEINNPRINYHHIKILSEVERIKKILPLIKTKYTILSSDDDLLLPNALSNCLEEIEKDEDIISCYGQTLSFYNINKELKFFRTDVDLKNFSNNSVMPIKRLKYHMLNYVPSIIYSVMLTKFFINIFDTNNFNKYKYHAAMEFRASLLINYYGRSKVTENLIVLRNKDTSSATKKNLSKTSFFRTLYYSKNQKIDFINDLVFSVRKIIKDQDAFYLNKIFNASLKYYLFFIIKIFFKKKLNLIITNNIPYLYKKKRAKKFSKLISLFNLKSYCEDEKIKLNDSDLNIIKKISFN